MGDLCAWSCHCRITDQESVLGMVFKVTLNLLCLIAN